MLSKNKMKILLSLSIFILTFYAYCDIGKTVTITYTIKTPVTVFCFSAFFFILGIMAEKCDSLD